MKTKTKMFFCMAGLGIIIMALCVIFGDNFDGKAEGFTAAAGGLLFAVGVGKGVSARWSEKYPDEMEQMEIEANDERNIIIRHKAQALSGMVLQWSTMAIAWIAVILDLPLWIILAAAGVFLGKTVLELILISYYQKRM